MSMCPHRAFTFILAGVFAIGTGTVASAQTVVDVRDDAGNSLGQVALQPVSCDPAATESLRIGLSLLHNMTYEQARDRFSDAVATDPDCLLGYWGAAMSYIHPLWDDRPTDEDLAAGSRLLVDAASRRASTPYEAAFLGAVHGYFRDASERTESERLRTFADGWEEAERQFPDDLEISLFHALSLLAVAQGRPDMVALHTRAGELAEEVLLAAPDHPGALHYTIHAFDLSELANRAEPAARAYGDVIPENGHALHMTSHIFTRIGDWEESVAYNRRATDAALRPPLDGLSLPNLFHAADYLVYALIQRGEYESARALHEDLLDLDQDLPQPPHPAAAYALAAIPARLALERQAWDEASRLESRPSSAIPWDRLPHLEAIPTFAAGLGAARSGDTDAADAALVQLSRLRENTAEMADPFDWTTQVRIQEVALEAWILFAAGDSVAGLRRMQEAAELEDANEKHGVSPGNVLPAPELYGDMLTEAGLHAAALTAYQKALETSPSRLNSLFGAGRAAEALGETDTARECYLRLVNQASTTADLDRVHRAAAFVQSAADSTRTLTDPGEPGARRSEAEGPPRCRKTRRVRCPTRT